MFAGKARCAKLLSSVILVALLLAGTFKVGLLTNSYGKLRCHCRDGSLSGIPVPPVPYDTNKGGVAAQGAIKIYSVSNRKHLSD
jgi:hypothetical protein